MGGVIWSSETGQTRTDHEDSNGPRLIILHYNGASHRLKVFPGTSSQELDTWFKRTLEIDSKQQLVFTDADGDPVAMSSSFPNGYQVHVSIKKEAVFPVLKDDNEDVGTGDWREWEKLNNLVKSSRTWEAESDDYGQRAMSKILSGNGKHYAVLNFSRCPCCVNFGFVEADMHPKHIGGRDVQEHMIYAQSMLLGPNYFKSDSSAGSGHTDPVRVGILADMDKKEVFMFPLLPRKNGGNGNDDIHDGEDKYHISY